MKPHMQTFVGLLSKSDISGIIEFYQNSSESENIGQLAFLFRQSQKNLQSFEPFQQLATKLITAKGLPKPLIEKINNSELLTFFTPALQSNWHFSRTDQRGRNVLHYLMLGVQGSTEHPPFIYLRSLMLFESNEVLQETLVQRDEDGLTPLELYFSANGNLNPLPNHEFTAVLALIEFQSRKEAIDSRHFKTIVHGVREMCFDQAVAMGVDLQRLQFIASFYEISVEQLLERLRS